MDKESAQIPLLFKVQSTLLMYLAAFLKDQLLGSLNYVS